MKNKIITEKEEIIRAEDELLSQRADTIDNLEQNDSTLTSKLDDLEQYHTLLPSLRVVSLKTHFISLQVTLGINDINACDPPSVLNLHLDFAELYFLQKPV